MNVNSLNGIWKISGTKKNGEVLSFDGSVPGCVHTDMIKLGIIKDPFVSNNSDLCRWIEEIAWTYEKSFDISYCGEQCFLHFDMLDVYCDVYLNGKMLGFCDNMFIDHSFDVTGVLKNGKNTLRVEFYPPAAFVADKPERSGAFTLERLYTRRIQCTYLWDWVDRFVTMGICGDVTLQCPEETEIDSVFVRTLDIDSRSAQLQISTDFSVVGSNTFLKIKILSPSDEVVYSSHKRIVEDNMTLNIDIQNPLLWYPSGYGEANLYKVCVFAEDENGNVLSEKSFDYGIRKVKILQLPDKKGSEYYDKCVELKKSDYLSHGLDKNEDFSGFTVCINNIPIMCKGANFVPSEPFVSSETPEKLTRILTLAKEAGMNFVRVWGGGIFEKEHFYSECNRLGIMVSQDFLMACGDYPQEDEEFCLQLAKEAEYITKKLRNNPCLIWWSGDNENAVEADDDMCEYSGRTVVRRYIEPIVRKNDPDRYFFPSSPFGGKPYGSATVGTAHNTYLLGDIFSSIIHTDLKDYKRLFTPLTRFSAEEPVLGATSEQSALKFMSMEEFLDENEEIWRFHTKTNPGLVGFDIYDCIRAGGEKLCGPYKNPYDKLYKMQYLQYEWIRLTMELNRRNKWFSSGILYWMLNDCWPAFGWSLIDYYTKPKAGWYAFKRSAKGLIASFGEEKACLGVYVCNDTLSHIIGTLTVYKVTGEKCITVAESEFSSVANTSQKLFEINADPRSEDGIYICDVRTEKYTDRAIWFRGRICDTKIESGNVEIVSDDESEVTLKANGFVHGVMLEADDAVFEENCFVMLDKEVKTVKYRNKIPYGKIKVYCI